MRRRSQIPGAKTAALLTLSGIASAVLIVNFRDPNAPLSNALAPAVQALFAAIVAAFGITQMLIARDAMQAARRTVVVTSEQTDVMRQQVQQAEEDAAQRSLEAEEALALARQERLDAHAPAVAVIGKAAKFGAARVYDEQGEIAPSPSSFHRDSEPWPDLFYEVDVMLHNFGAVPIHYRVRLNGPHFRISSPEQGVAWPGDTPIRITRRHSPQEWMGFKGEHEDAHRATGDDDFLRIRVETEGPSRFVHDTHVLCVGPPSIRRKEDDTIVIVSEEVAVDRLGVVERYYVMGV